MQAYGATIVPLLFAPELSGKPGLHFSQGGDAVLGSKQLADPAKVADILKISREMVARALAAKLT